MRIRSQQRCQIGQIPVFTVIISSPSSLLTYPDLHLGNIKLSMWERRGMGTPNLERREKCVSSLVRARRVKIAAPSVHASSTPHLSPSPTHTHTHSAVRVVLTERRSRQIQPVPICFFLIPSRAHWIKASLCQVPYDFFLLVFQHGNGNWDVLSRFALEKVGPHVSVHSFAHRARLWPVSRRLAYRVCVAPLLFSLKSIMFQEYI